MNDCECFADLLICGCLYNPGCIASDWMDCLEWWADVWMFERDRGF